MQKGPSYSLNINSYLNSKQRPNNKRNYNSLGLLFYFGLLGLVYNIFMYYISNISRTVWLGGLWLYTHELLS